jgi:alpha-tubulin suppressor-like RCC1 family protein
MRGSHHGAVLLVLILASGCGRTELLARSSGASGGRRAIRDADIMSGAPDAGSVAHTGGQDGAASTQADARTRVPRVTKIAAGSYTACALKSDGTVKCWAAFESSATPIPDARQATDVAIVAGERYPPYSMNPNDRIWAQFCVAMQGGISCGSTSGLNRIMDGDVLSLSVGVHQTCAVMRGGRVRCAGWATDLDPIKKAAHVQVGTQEAFEVPGMSDALQVSAGDGLVCAVLKDGSTACFGDVRDDVVTDASLPQTMSVPGAVDLSAADGHYCVVTAEGKVVCAGCLYNGAGGGPYFICGSHEIDLTAFDLRPAQQIRTSYTHRCVRLADGAVRCWGNNDYGEIGYTSWGAASPLHDIEGLANVTDIAVGVHFSCALTTAGEVYCWGGDIKTPPPSKPNFRQIMDL